MQSDMTFLEYRCPMFTIELDHIDEVFAALQRRGYVTLGPTVRDGAIVLDEVRTRNDLPIGVSDEQKPGSYALRSNGTASLFGYVVGPQSWKKFLYPARLKLFSARRNGKGFSVESNEQEEKTKFAFVGVRSCEVHAIKALDAVFLDGQYVDRAYAQRREPSFVLAVNCTRAGENCFCASMNTGPRATSAFDLAMTEVLHDGKHYFVVEIGSARGEELLADVPHREASSQEMEEALSAIARAAEAMTKTVDTSNLVEVLNTHFEHPRWDDVAKRCLACANCTLVCPTCFCSTVEDVTDLTGDHAERWRVWDSCFTADFTKIAGGNIRMSTRTRYRQWLMHKFAHWQGQFGTFGCVGCGRCITWCPAGIDITQEVHALRTSPVTTKTS
jgi:sulfhydrogenase subunit beta (sulfur reductase)